LQHQSERGVKTKSFSKGVSDIPKLSAQEMPAVLLMIIACLGDDGDFLPVAVSREWTSLAWELIIIRGYLMADDWTSEMRANFKLLVPRVMKHFAAVVGESRKPGDWKLGVAFPKFHLLLHYESFMLEYGPPVLSYSGFNESGHKFFVKKPATRTQRRLATFADQVRKRLDFVSKFRSVIASMKAHYQKWSPFTSRAPSSTGQADQFMGRGTKVDINTCRQTTSWIHSGARKAIVEHVRKVTNAPTETLVYRAYKKRLNEEEYIIRADPEYGTATTDRMGHRTGPWLDFVEIKYETEVCGTNLRYAECHGFFKVGSKFFVVVQELRPSSTRTQTTEAAEGPFRQPFRSRAHFPFSKHKRVYHNSDLEFEVFETTAINNTAFLIPAETDSAARTRAAPASFSKTFWAVPQVEKWIGPLAA
jgi:hypothetical protein